MDAPKFPPSGPTATQNPALGSGTDIVLAAFSDGILPISGTCSACPPLGDGRDYFKSSAVQTALHAPSTNYPVCGEFDLFTSGGDQSVPSGLGP